MKQMNNGKLRFFLFMKLRVLTNSAGLCWVMRIPMLSGSFCKWCLPVLVVLIRLVMLALQVELVLLV